MRERLARCRPDQEANEADLRSFEWYYLAGLAAWASIPPVRTAGPGHQGEVYCARWIWGHVITGGQDGTIRLWEEDLPAPKAPAGLDSARPHGRDINGIDISPGARVASI
jgi:WD40 repeat protein